MEHPTDSAPFDTTVLVPSDPAYSRVLAIQNTRFIQLVTQLCDAWDTGDSLSDDVISQIRLICERNPIRVPEYVSRSGEWTGYRAGTGHFLWHGTTDAKTGIPVISRWYDEAGELRRNVPVYRVLWSLFRSDELVGRPHKLETCSARNCANPLCYGIVIPMLTRGTHEGEHGWKRRRGAWARRPMWYSGRGGLAGEAPNQYPVCIQCKQRLHMGDYTLGDWISKYEGKQINCTTCRHNDEAMRESMGLRGPADAYDFSSGYGPRNPAPDYRAPDGSRVSRMVWNAIQVGLEEDARQAQLACGPDDEVDKAT